LLTNAVKFTPAAGTVRVTVRRLPASVQLVVEDTGIGIEPAFIGFVFDRFRQADASMTRTVSGLGLGLALVNDLVQMHGGTVRAESEGTNRGSRFTVSFPEPVAGGVKDAGSAAVPAPPPAPEPVPPPSRTGRILAGVDVLLVDDDADFLESLEVALQARGARVTRAENARAALAALDKALP